MNIRNSDKTFKVTRLPEKVAEYLTAEIRNGNIPVGEILPSEATLSKDLGVSRTVIREALARIKFEGLIESRQGIGAVIVGDNSSKIYRLDSWNKDNLADWDSLYELRSILEAEAAVLAAKRAGKDDIEHLKNRLNEWSEASIKKADGLLFDIQFHRAVARASQNPYLESLLNFIINTLLREILREKRSRSPAGQQSLYHEHQQIYQAIESGKPELAKKAVLYHLENSFKDLRKSKLTGKKVQEKRDLSL